MQIKLVIFLIFSVISNGLTQSHVDILIIGGGAGGTAAGIQAARAGVTVQIIESTPWLGGMLTSAGVSAIDGNHNLPSGIWGEFREHLREHYGGADALATGWVSHTLFEPSVGQNILKEMANYDNLELVLNANYQNVQKTGDKWVVSYEKEGKEHSTIASILIDATETGELLPLVGADFRLGMDSKSDTGEKVAPDLANNIIQDLTYVAILEDVSENSKKLKSKIGIVKKPKHFDPKNYECACSRAEDKMFGKVSDCQQMLNYGKLPNNKYMINWPNCGNDYYINWSELGKKELESELEKAKAFTLGFVYYIQNQLGFNHLRLANEFKTKDHLPFIPYHREGRRLQGKIFLTVDHLEKPYDYNLYKTGIAVGDYPIDHHHDKNASAPEIEFINIKIPSYNVPLGTLIPEETDNFLVADKNISVSNIVNGSTRLQPVVLGIGQATGALAAVTIKQNKNVNEVSVRDVQGVLLENGVYLMPYVDVSPNDEAFSSIQRIGATGIIKGYGVPYKWANQTFFYPDRIVSEYELKSGLLDYYPKVKTIQASGYGVTITFLLDLLSAIGNNTSLENVQTNWSEWHLEQPFSLKMALNRKSLSILLDKILDPFSTPIDLEGNFLGEQ